jgi:two-component system sensor histidine kinase MprB
MSLRGRLTLAASVAVAAAVAVASVAAFLLVRGQLRREVDTALVRRADEVTDYLTRRQSARDFRSLRNAPKVPPPRFGEAGGLTQLIAADGSVLRDPEQLNVPVTARARTVAEGASGSTFEDVRTGGSHIRVLTVPLTDGLALQVARPLDETDHILGRFGFLLLGVMFGGVVLAAALGRAVAHTALRPVDRLTQAAEKVAETRDLAHRIAGGGGAELGRLASSFNSMLEALDDSLRSQRQLIADASHELRTPLTSLKTNIEVLSRGGRLPSGERGKILSDLSTELDELTVLLGDLIELARGEEKEILFEDVRLGELVQQTVKSVRSRWPEIEFVVETDDSLVPAVRERLNRAVMNLLENAAKWSPPGSSVEISVKRGEVSIKDHGPGVSDEDLPRVFDRFYRAASARGMPGSGLGLAIVKQIAEQHSGSVKVESSDGNGSTFRLQIPLEREPVDAV